MSTTEQAATTPPESTGDEERSPGVPGAARRSYGQSNVLLYIERFALPTAFVIMLLFFSFWGKTGHIFRQSANFQDVASSQAYLGILVLASIIPLVCGEFDFSVGQVAGFTQIVAATSMSRFHLNLGTSVLVAVAFGALIGLNNGNAVARIGVNSLIVTLGTSGILLGLVDWYTHGQSIGRGISGSLTNFGANNWFGVPQVFYLLVLAALVVYYLLEHTPYGRYLTSIGSNAQAARLVGLNVKRLKLSAFVLSGALAGVAGVLLVARNGAGNPGAGTVVDTLTALAAVFLGATAIKPGRFNVLGSMIAVYFIAFTVTGLQVAGVQSWINNVFNGAALFVAVVVSTSIGRKRTGIT
jgi:ribose transport system permease protein